MNHTLCTKLKATILEFVKDVSHIATQDEQYLVSSAQVFFNITSDRAIMSKCVRFVLPRKEEIVTRQSAFLDKGLLEILRELTGANVSLSLGGRLSEEDQRVIWNYLDIILALVEKYKKNP